MRFFARRGRLGEVKFSRCKMKTSAHYLETRRQFLRKCSSGFGALSTAAIIGCKNLTLEKESLLRVGASKQKLTSPICIPYLTSSMNGTNAPFHGTHDDLHVRALVVDDGRKAIALIAVDSIGYDNMVLGRGRNFTRELRQKIAAHTKLKPEAIMLTATHAHSTPETIGLTPFRESKNGSAWLENHLEELAAITISAWKNREPCRAFSGVKKVQGIARYRRIVLKNGKLSVHGALPSPENVAVPWALDEDLSTLYFERVDGSPHAALLNYTAHPVVAMLLPNVCADFPGVATAAVEENLKGSVCLFTNGAAGNINSVHVSTNYGDVETLGKKLSHAAIEKIQKLKTLEALKSTAVDFQSSETVLTARDCPSLQEVEENLALDSSAKNRALHRLKEKLNESPLNAELQMMSIGDVKWISLPGEPFVETGFALKKSGASFVVGYANGWLGYFPIGRAYAEGGYEAMAGAWSRVAPGSAEILETEGKRLLRRRD